MAYPISDQGYDLNKQQFWDCVRLRYSWRLTNIPSACSCGSKIAIQYAMSCKKGGFIAIRHNDLRDLTVNLLTELCKDVNIEPQLLTVWMKHLTIDQPTLATKQDSIYNHGGSGWEVNRHSLMWGYLTQTPIGISTSTSTTSILHPKWKKKKRKIQWKSFRNWSW